MVRLAAVAAVAAVLAGAALALRPAPALFGYPLQEDGYLALTVARRAAIGEGFTADGVRRTNGFQPLWVLAAASCFVAAGGDRELGVRLVIFAQTLVYAGGALLLARCAALLFPGDGPGRGARLGVVAAAVYLLASAVWENSYTGMETGMLFAAYAAVLHLMLARELCGGRGAAALGAVAGLLVLVRIDAVFFVAALGPVTALAEARRAGSGAGAAWLAGYGVAAFLVTSPWWAFNVLQFGHLMPVSGLATTGPWTFAPSRIGAAAAAALRGLVPQTALHRLPPPGAAAAHLAAVAFQVGAILLLVRRGAGEGSRPPAAAARRWGLALLAGTAALLAWYATRSTATWFYPRYLSYLALVGAVLTALLVATLGARSRLLGCAALLALAALHVRTNGFAFAVPGPQDASPALELVRRHVDPAATVAAAQSGTLGFFRDRVLNLDGKVNPEALAYRGRLNEYLDRAAVDWVCDDDYALSVGFRPNPDAWEVVDRIDRVVLWHRRAPSAPASGAAGRG